MPGSLLHRWQTSSMNFWHAIASKIWLAEMQNIKFRTPPGRQWTKILQFKAKRKTLEPLKFQGFLWSARSIWIFTTRKLRPSGRRRLCAVQAFCHRQNLGAGRIHFARAFQSLKGGATNGSETQKKMRLVETSRMFFWWRRGELNYWESVFCCKIPYKIKPFPSNLAYAVSCC